MRVAIRIGSAGPGRLAAFAQIVPPSLSRGPNRGRWRGRGLHPVSHQKPAPIRFPMAKGPGCAETTRPSPSPPREKRRGARLTSSRHASTSALCAGDTVSASGMSFPWPEFLFSLAPRPARERRGVQSLIRRHGRCALPQNVGVTSALCDRAESHPCHARRLDCSGAKLCRHTPTADVWRRDPAAVTSLLGLCWARVCSPQASARLASDAKNSDWR